MREVVDVDHRYNRPRSAGEIPAVPSCYASDGHPASRWVVTSTLSTPSGSWCFLLNRSLAPILPLCEGPMSSGRCG